MYRPLSNLTTPKTVPCACSQCSCVSSSRAVSGCFQAGLREMHNKQALCNKNLGKQTIPWHRQYWKDNGWFLNHPQVDGVGGDYGCIREGHKPRWSTWMNDCELQIQWPFLWEMISLQVDPHIEDWSRDLLMLDKGPTTELHPQPPDHDHILKKVKRLHRLQNSRNEKKIY